MMRELFLRNPKTINVTKLRKNPDDWHDFTLPPEPLEWSAENYEQWPGIPADALNRNTDAPNTPVAAPGTPDSSGQAPGYAQVGHWI